MRRRAKLLVALLLVAGSLTLVLWNTQAQAAAPALAVSDAKYRAPGDVVVVRGTVVEGSIVESGGMLHSFVVEDTHERMRVDYAAPPPDNFGAKQVVVHGTVRHAEDGTPYLEGSAIQVGCASKY